MTNGQGSGAVGYFRVSTKEQAVQNNSLPVQDGKFKGYCTSNNLPVLCTFLDKQSARTDKRPEFQRMLEYCQKNHKQISCVIVADLSRFARNVVDQGTSIMTLKQLGIDVVSIDEPITDDTAAGKLARNMLGSMNQFFSDSLSEKTKFRMAAGVKQGRWLWVAPVGYLNADKKVLVDGQRAPLVRKAFELIGNGGYATTEAVLLKPTAYLLSKIPELAARSWEDRKSRIAADAKVLSNRLAEQNTLNQKAIVAKLNGTLSEDDFQLMKKSVNEEKLRIESDIKTLDSERSSMEDLNLSDSESGHRFWRVMA